MSTKTMDDIWALVEPTGFCWLWQGYLTDEGYGSAWLDGATTEVHRRVFEFLVGPIAPGLVLDHLCRVRSCVNPDHLEPVTPLENTRRSNALRSLRDMCPHGHLWTPANSLDYGGRRCRECAVTRKHMWVGKECSFDSPCDLASHDLSVYFESDRRAA